jgi:hypothetical protein
MSDNHDDHVGLYNDFFRFRWPTHDDGRPKKMGEMTPDERKACWRDAALKVKAEMESPAMQAKLAAILVNPTTTRQ